MDFNPFSSSLPVVLLSMNDASPQPCRIPKLINKHVRLLFVAGITGVGHVARDVPAPPGHRDYVINNGSIVFPPITLMLLRRINPTQIAFTLISK